MKLTPVISVIAALIMTSAIPAQAASTWAIVVHGGAGVIERKDLSPEQETAYRAAMNRAIQAGAFEASINTCARALPRRSIAGPSPFGLEMVTPVPS